ncbi:MAG: cytochrome-c oxidase, cbb3-type subunit III [Lautropia sp.]
MKADFISGFWSNYILIITVVSIAFCFYMIAANSKKPPQTKDNTTGHVWDGDIREANNPLPRWWVGLFLLTLFFGIGYLIYYPGLGAFAGVGKWDSVAMHEAEKKELNDSIAPLYAGFLSRKPDELVGDPKAMAIGERLFLNNCSQCHGSDARGSKGFPNLTDSDWLYGGTADAIKTTIVNGRNGVMPPMAAALGGGEGVEQVAQYVLSLSGTATDPVKAQLGREKFAVCAACHGADGKGNQAIGAPNLTDQVWLHVAGLNGIIQQINQGKTNQMPQHGTRLTEGQIHVLTGYVMSLSRPAAKQVSQATQ